MLNVPGEHAMFLRNCKRQASVVFPTKINSLVYIMPVVQLNGIGVKFTEQVKYLNYYFMPYQKIAMTDRLSSSTKTPLNALACIGADDAALPLFVLFPGKSVNNTHGVDNTPLTAGG